MAPEMIRGK
jgi:serine/threonine protein kinase